MVVVVVVCVCVCAFFSLFSGRRGRMREVGRLQELRRTRPSLFCQANSPLFAGRKQDVKCATARTSPCAFWSRTGRITYTVHARGQPARIRSPSYPLRFARGNGKQKAKKKKKNEKKRGKGGENFADSSKCG